MAEEANTTEVAPTTTEVSETVVPDASTATDTDLQSRLSPEDYGYVQGLREEAKAKRLEAEHYKTAFDGFDTDTADAFLEAVKLIRQNPAEAHDVFKGLVDELAVAAGITKKEAKELVTEAVAQGTAPVADIAADVITPEKLEEYLSQREAKKQEDAVTTKAKEEIDTKIADLGYKPGTKQFNDLLYYATTETEGTPVEKLDAAHTKIAAERQAVIDEFLAAQNSQNAGFPPQSDGQAPNAEVADQPKSVKAGAKAARKALDAIYAANE